MQTTTTNHQTAADIRGELTQAREKQQTYERAAERANAAGRDDEADYLSGCAEAAGELVEALEEQLRDRLRTSDEPRSYEIRCEDGGSEVVTARPSEIEQIVADWIAEGSWGVDGVVTETMWIDAWYICEESGEREQTTVTLEPAEPDCTEDEHDWQSPHELVGGVRGNAGGVIVTEACLRCGCRRTTDTWAQRPDTGEQGLTSVSYEPGAYADDIVPHSVRRVAAELDGCDVAREAAAYLILALRSREEAPRACTMSALSERQIERLAVVLDEIRAELPADACDVLDERAEDDDERKVVALVRAALGLDE